MSLLLKLNSLLLLSAAIALPAAGADFRGVVLNQKEKPLKDVRLWKKNSFEGVKTDSEGRFKIADLTPADTVVVAVNDKNDAVIPVKDLTDVTLVLDKKAYMLNGERRDYVKVGKLKYSSNILEREQIMRSSASSIYELLRGSIAGVNVLYGDNGQMISIRGGNSMELDSEPLFIVDGAQYESSRDVESGVSVDDIVRVEVLKDGSAYGMKGSNGVIIISTLKVN